MYDFFYLLGIDPGNNTGVAIYKIDSTTLDIVDLTTWVVVLNNIINAYGDVQLERNKMLSRIANNLSEIYNPNVLAMEAAFLNSRFPKAVMQLSQYTSTIEQTFINNNPFIKLFKYPPKYIKKYIGGGGNADKDRMLLAVKETPELLSYVELDRITEHEVDAIAIGYVALLELRLYPHLLISY
jgi:Holliday junction resolvasome RuvABC endonuclease subunit